MRMKKGKIFIGTSGWSYKHWKGVFYPPSVKDDEMFSFYQLMFNTVEINSSFYHLPLEQTFTNWRNNTSDQFLFSVKASRFITHMKKLAVDHDSVDLFLNRAEKLKDKLGPILFQLPPSWELNIERLESFLELLPENHRYTFEMRNHTWYTKEVYELLEKYNCAFCTYELEHHLSPVQVTADFIYIRLHGPGNKYQGSYTLYELKKWAHRCQKWMENGLDVFVYFDNDQKAYAAYNALTLNELIQNDSTRHFTTWRLSS